MNSKQRREQREKEIALNSWYSCMIAMGMVPKDEDLYFETKERFLKKHRIKNTSSVKTTCDKEYSDIKRAYHEKSRTGFERD